MNYLHSSPTKNARNSFECILVNFQSIDDVVDLFIDRPYNFPSVNLKQLFLHFS